MPKTQFCKPSDDVCLAHSLPLVTTNRCEIGDDWHKRIRKLKQRLAKRLWMEPQIHVYINECIDEWARKESLKWPT
jgi:hypothetical protein